MKGKVTSTVKAYNIEEDKGYFGILLEDREEQGEWLNGSLGTGKGKFTKEFVQSLKDVKAEFELMDNDSFIDITNISPVEKQNQEGGSSSAGKVMEGVSTGQTHLSKQDRIMLQTAFKEACETVRGNGGQKDVGKHVEQVNTLTNGYFNLMQDQVKDSDGGGE